MSSNYGTPLTPPLVEYIRGRSREHEPPNFHGPIAPTSERFMDAMGRVWRLWGATQGFNTVTTYQLRTLESDPLHPTQPRIDHECDWESWNLLFGPMHEAIVKPPRALEEDDEENTLLEVVETEDDRRREARLREMLDQRYETPRVKDWRWLLDQRHVGLLDISLDSKTEDARRAGVDILAFPRPWPVPTLDPNVTVSRLTKPYDGAMNPLPEAQHLPVFDLDLPAYTIPSSTPGHTHLYINRPISTEQYQRILDAFVAAGLVQEGFARRLDVDGYCTLRLPWVRKEINEPEPGQEPPRPPAPLPPPPCDTCHGFGVTTVDDIHTGGYREVPCPICSEPPFL